MPTWPLPDDDVHAALETVYTSGDWGRYFGERVEQLTAALAKMHDVAHAFCCASGTVAVELALRGVGVGSDDEVILAGYDFGGNFRCIEDLGATPVLVDIDPSTWCPAVDQVTEAMSDRVKAILVSHLHGGLADMTSIRQLADERGVAVVEDACQTPGGIVQGRPAGTWGDVGVLSFGGSKLLTAGRGGAIVTNRADVHQRIKIFCERGNHAFPLSELQAAVLPPQLKKLATQNTVRRENVRRLLELCEGLSSINPISLDKVDGEASFYKVAWLYQQDRCNNVPRPQIIEAVRAEGVAIDAGFRGFTRRRSNRCRKVGTLEDSRLASEGTLLLHHPVLLETPDRIEQVAFALKKVLNYFGSGG